MLWYKGENEERYRRSHMIKLLATALAALLLVLCSGIVTDTNKKHE